MKTNTIFAMISMIAVLGIMGTTIGTEILLQKVNAASCQQFYDSNGFVRVMCSKSHSSNSAFNFNEHIKIK
jgi:hypothetical protein